MAGDYYELLGVPRDATTQDIKRAFRQIARECHPDLAGGDTIAVERFKICRKAYETLMDPVARAQYDRRGERRRSGGGSFFDAFYKSTHTAPAQRTGPSFARHTSGGPSIPSGKTGRHDPGNDVSLDDLFNDFGDFGFGKGRSRQDPTAAKPRKHRPESGRDVSIELDVPRSVAREGGSVTAVYYRMQRADSWRPGAIDPGLIRVQDIADVRIIPRTRDGEVLRERGLGDAGPWGGAYGDLVARVHLVGDDAPKADPDAKEAEPEGLDDPVVDHIDLDISIPEAVLGGRVALETPGGSVRLTIPPGTSSGSRLRLKGKGTDGVDLYVVLRIVVPRVLDDESRDLIEKFARLNPDDPRG
jgi:DnaJ-class molecular chaperone